MAYTANATLDRTASECVREPHIHVCTSELNDVIERLAGSLGGLEKRLASVLTPAGPSCVAKDSAQAPRPLRAPLVDTLDGSTDKVRGLIGTVDDLLQRLEV